MKSFFVITFWSLCNKFLGLVRTQLTQRLLGASIESDGFNLAFRMIGFFRSIFTDGSFYTFFTSYFAKYEKKEDKFAFARGIIFVFSLIFIGLNLLAFLFPLAITKIFTFSFITRDFKLTWETTEKVKIISHYAKYMFPISLSMFLTSAFSAILFFYKEVFHSSFGLVLGSLCNVFFVYLGIGNPHYSSYLITGTVSYSFIHAIYMGVVIYKKYYIKTPLLYSKDFFKKVSLTGLMQILNQLVYLFQMYIFASMKAGGYSYVGYGEQMAYFIFVLVAGNLSNLISSILSSAQKEESLFKSLCDKYMSMCFFLSIFPTVFLIIHSQIVTEAVYANNAKTNLFFLSLAIKHAAFSTPFWCLNRILLTFFISRGELKEQNLSNFFYRVFSFLFSFLFLVITNKYPNFFSSIFLTDNSLCRDFLGIIWSMNLAIILVVLGLLIRAYYKKIFFINNNTFIHISIKTLASYFLLNYGFSALPNHWNLPTLFIKIIFLYIIYCLICYKDVKKFLEK